MGLGGIDSNVSQPAVAFEGELTSILEFGERGYARRHYSLGAAYLSYDESKFAMLSFVTRIFSESRSEPEVRIRAGMEGSTGSFAAGLNLGYRWPFSLVAGAHVSGYVEGSGICVLLDGGKNPTAVGTLGVGLGFHF
jgi:hypothetical protein